MVSGECQCTWKKKGKKVIKINKSGAGRKYFSNLFPKKKIDKIFTRRGNPTVG